MHAWYVDRDYVGKAEPIPVSLKDPTARMPWQDVPRCEQCDGILRPKRSTARFCSDSTGRSAGRPRATS